MKKLIFGLMFLCAYVHAEEADVAFFITSGTLYGSFSGTETLTMGYFVGDGSGLINISSPTSAIAISTGAINADLQAYKTTVYNSTVALWNQANDQFTLIAQSTAAIITSTGAIYSALQSTYTYLEARGGSDNLGNHIATITLQMGAYGINTSSNINANVYDGNELTIGDNISLIEITGSGGPVSPNGTYLPLGTYSGDPTYSLGTSFYIWRSISDVYWALSTEIGSLESGWYCQNNTLSNCASWNIWDVVTGNPAATYVISKTSIDQYGNIVASNSNITATYFYGSFKGNADSATKVTGTVASTQVAAGAMNNMTSATASSATITGNAFSVGGSTLVVTNGNVGIGTTNPLTKLHLLGTNSVNIYLDISQNAYQEIPQGFSLSASTSLSILTGNVTGAKTEIAYHGDTYNSALEITNVESGYSNLLLMKSGGNVGIGTTTPSALLSIQSGANWSKINAGDATWTYSSSKDLKANIKYLTPDSAKFAQLKPAQYNFRIDKSSDSLHPSPYQVISSTLSYGLIADNVHAVYPEQPASEINGNFIQAQRDLTLIDMINKVAILEKRIATLEAKK